MEKPLVSVCMITYNHEKFIKDAIEGVLMQKTQFTFELIIGEDCSTDRTSDIVKEYASRNQNIIIALCSNFNQGMKNNFISVINVARGKYIALCEGDDYWTDPYKLQKQVNFLEMNSDFGMTSSDIILINENGNLIKDNNMVIKQRSNRKKNPDFFDLLRVNMVNTPTVCIRQVLLKSLVDRLISENLWFVYDYWYWLNIAMNSKIEISTEKMAAYRIHKGGLSRKQDYLKSLSPYLLQDVILNYRLKFPNKKLTSEQKKIITNKLISIIKNRFSIFRFKVWGIKELFIYLIFY